jgi:hypothetical protein
MSNLFATTNPRALRIRAGPATRSKHVRSVLSKAPASKAASKGASKASSKAASLSNWLHYRLHPALVRPGESSNAYASRQGGNTSVALERWLNQTRKGAPASKSKSKSKSKGTFVVTNPLRRI